MMRTLTAFTLALAAAAFTSLPAAAQTPQGQARQGQAPQGQAPQGPAPQGQAPQRQAPQGQAPQGQAPQGQTPQAQGSVQPDRAKMEAYLGSPAYLSLLQQAMLDAEKGQTTPCANVTGTKRIGLAVMAPIAFEGAQPKQGTWWDRLEADRCGKPMTYNLLVTHRPGEGSRAAPLLMGTTKADPILQRDAKPVVMEMAATAPGKNKCKEHKIENTLFQGPEKPAQGEPQPGAAAWTELWTTRGCGRQVPVQVRFAPTPQGTAISARLANAARG